MADNLANVLRQASETAERLIPRIDRIYPDNPGAAAEMRQGVEALKSQLASARLKIFPSNAGAPPLHVVIKLKVASDNLDNLIDLIDRDAALAQIAHGASDFIAATTEMMAALPGNPTTDPVRTRPTPAASGR